jgi:hypothetical protein
MRQNAYLQINLIIASLIGLIFLYAFLYPLLHTFQIAAITGQEVASTGLSRAFAEIVRLHFNQAFQFNRYALHVFGFFFFQFFARITIGLLLFYKTIQRNKLLSIDIILSVLLFLWGFGGMVFHQFLLIKW